MKKQTMVPATTWRARTNLGSAQSRAIGGDLLQDWRAIAAVITQPAILKQERAIQVGAAVRAIKCAAIGDFLGRCLRQK